MIPQTEEKTMTRTVIINGTAVAMPTRAVAYKHADPTEDARWVYDDDEAREIAREDISLIVYPASE